MKILIAEAKKRDEYQIYRQPNGIKIAKLKV